MSTHNICFRGEIRKIFTRYPLLSRPMTPDKVTIVVIILDMFLLFLYENTSCVYSLESPH